MRAGPFANEFSLLTRLFGSGAMTRAAAAAVGCVALVVSGLMMAAAAPEPDAVPSRWQLDLRTGPMRVVSLDLPETGPRAYYYMPYTVSNSSGEDLLFAPSFDLATDEGELMRSGRGVPIPVTRTIIEGLQNPFVEDQIAIIGQLLQGKENAKDGVVIWPVGQHDATEVTVYAAGFSGETATEIVAATGKKVVLRKTLMIRFRVPGTLESQRATPLEEIERRWIMR
jgi:hypothetical protein